MTQYGFHASFSIADTISSLWVGSVVYHCSMCEAVVTQTRHVSCAAPCNGKTTKSSYTHQYTTRLILKNMSAKKTSVCVSHHAD